MKRIIKYNILEGDPNFISPGKIWIDKDSNTGKILAIKVRNPDGALEDVVNMESPLETALKQLKLEFMYPILYDEVLETRSTLDEYGALPDNEGIIKASSLFNVVVGGGTDKYKVHYLPRILLDQEGISTSSIFREWYSIREIQEIIFPNNYQAQFVDFFYRSFSFERVLQKIKLPDGVVNLSGCFSNCACLREFPIESTKNIVNMKGMLVGCYSLTSIILDMSSVTTPGYAEIFSGSSGSKYLTNITMEGTIYVDCSSYVFGYLPNLNKESVLSIIDALADYSSGDVHKIILGPTNLEKLTESEKAIATNKNWTLS